MTAHIHLLEELKELLGDARDEKAGKLLEECPSEICEHIRVMFTDQQLMGAELAHKAEFFAYLCKETARVPEKERESSERFKEFAMEKSRTLKFLSSAIPILDHDPSAYTFFRAIIIQAFRSQETCYAHTT